MRALWAGLLLAACSSSPRGSGDVVGPFPGEVHRFVVDRMTLPLSTSQARDVADDLDGDRVVDNQGGIVISTLFGLGDGNAHGADAIASGVLASTLEIQTADLADAPVVGVTYRGADGDLAVPVGGTLVGGVFTSNRTLTTAVPGEAVLRLPVFADADPIAVHVVGLELDLTPDGAGGFTARLAGGIPRAEVLAPIAAGMFQMIAAHPHDHVTLARLIDTHQDGVLTEAELAGVPLIQSLTAPDVDLFDGDHFAPGNRGTDKDALSLAIEVHVRPCPDGTCATPATSCFDRVRDGDETGLDCGGSCAACPGGEVCRLGSDCETGACETGHCRAPSCADAVANGFESDVDCGDACGGCAAGRRCFTNADCLSGFCDSSTGLGGRCH